MKYDQYFTLSTLTVSMPWAVTSHYNERNKIKNKIRHIRESAQKKQSGTEHSNSNKR